MKLPTRAQAQRWIDWAYERNPGPWREHSRGVAMAAERIAAACGMDGEAAWVLGLLHDIGRYEGVGALRHVYDGYRFLTDEGYPDAARICLTHSFAVQDLDTFLGRNDCTEEETAALRRALEGAVYDDYDRLIQLCDGIVRGDGVCIMEKRLVDVVMRHGINDRTLDKWRAHFALKERFEQKLGRSIYSLFDGVYENTVG